MNAVIAIARREVEAYFGGPLGWIVLSAWVIVSGVFFVLMLIGYLEASAQSFSPYGGGDVNLNEYIVQPFFGNMGVIAMLAMPAVTMRLLAEDRAKRSLELLLTSPISSLQIVLGKFLGGLGFCGVLMLGMSSVPLVLYQLGEPDSGIFLANVGSFTLLMATYVAVGLFCSALTENQIVAAVVAFGINIVVWIVGWAGQSADGAIKTVLEYLSMLTHLENLGKGLVHAEDLVYFVSFIVFFLFATTQRVEALRWR
jgi:ABC-2 type transport system permease protein